MKLIPTILCGGAGSRLWPVSREQHPKPFIRLADGQSLLQKAWLRGADLPHVSETLTITNRDLFFKTESEYREIATKSATPHLMNRYVLEPFGRNTAPAIAVATLQVAARHGENACLLVLAADHLISDQASFASAVMVAMALAEKGKLVTFGIKPSSPETGYGYIEAEGTEVKRFVEKPDIETARSYVESGRYLWNSGMFCFQAGVMLHEMAIHCPGILEATRACMENSPTAEGEDFSQQLLAADTFQLIPEDSIDYAVMEKSLNVAVVACDIGWSDIGSWSALGDLTSPDDDGNRIEGKVILRDVHDCFIQSNQRLVGAVGVQGLVIIDTADALLIADRNRTQEVKHLYASLKEQEHESHRLHTTVHRPWGTYTVLEEGPAFKLKRIVVKPGASLSLQMHHYRSEHWVVVSGTAMVVNGASEIIVQRNESTYIPAGTAHRLTNPGDTDCVMIEVQTGDYLGEDDIVRLEDIYGRV
jgi:mannose-1-phosphate guanylyltransferase/mannose-6-phosphate isomerase